ncbi:fibronectin type III-like domain-contianing protein [Chryseobacterium gambrini]|uniref:fibronectin type III-like domain-contianing protein n=1 Tax=Chryseobacterium gambrini TaxID=373672 RepID=UPI0022F1DC0A|nr:fibronectin type III-like domain-contianing protein [Chryseobacterium gambrini]WBV52835.1 fibronectin type III-like domain-contianing protein [Chryseobacterium gambrini]
MFTAFFVLAQVSKKIKKGGSSAKVGGYAKSLVNLNRKKVLSFTDHCQNLGTKQKVWAQLYIQDEFAPVARPVKELKGFQIVELKSGESKKISFNLTEKELGFYDNSGNFIVEEGAFKVMVGGNSESVISDEFGLE